MSASYIICLQVIRYMGIMGIVKSIGTTFLGFIELDINTTYTVKDKG